MNFYHKSGVFVSGVAATFGYCAGISSNVQLHEIQMKYNNSLVAEEKLRKQRLIRQEEANKYNTLRALSRKSISICRKWTNSSCTDADDIIKFIRLYSIERAHQEQFQISIPSQFSVNETDAIHEYTSQMVNFFKHYDREIDTIGYPHIGEFKSFLTFHWAIYKANNICAYEFPYKHHLSGDIKTHSDSFNYLVNNGGIQCTAEIREFQDKVRPKMVEIHNEIFPESPIRA